MTVPATCLDAAAGVRLFPGFLNQSRQRRLVSEVAGIAAQSPFFQPVMPRTGQPFSVEMTNAGRLGWISDRSGYRYSPNHPVTGTAWPAMPNAVLELWRDLADYPHAPECCLINRYHHVKARMGLHQDRDEETFAAPVVSVSLGDTAVFRIGGTTRRGPTQSFRLHSGDVLVLFGDARLAYHGIDRLLYGSSPLIPGGGRLNLTLRRVTSPA